MSNTTVPISEWCKEIRVALARKEMNLQSVADEIGYSYTTITALVVEEKPAKKKAENTIQLFHRLVEDYNISEPVREKMEVWFRYKMERKESYKEQGMKSLLKKTENNEGSYGANEICNLIEDCMANNWKGIIWKILEERKQQRPATRTEQIQQRVSEVDSW